MVIHIFPDNYGSLLLRKMMREGIKQILEVDQEIEVIAEASSEWECLKHLEKCSPDIILMDVRMPGISGIEACRLVH